MDDALHLVDGLLAGVDGITGFALAAFDDENVDVRRMALEAVRSLGNDDDVSRALRSAMSDEDTSVSLRALWLGQELLGADVVPMARAFALDTNRDPMARREAARLLDQLGEEVDLSDLPAEGGPGLPVNVFGGY